MEYKVEGDEKGNVFWRNKEGKGHREGGLPAVEWANGDKSYYVNGKQYTEEECKKMFNKEKKINSKGLLGK